MRNATDYTTVLQDKLKDALEQKYSNIEGKKNNLTIKNITFAPAPDADDYAHQKDILGKRDTLSVKILGDVNLTDKNGNLIESKEKMRIGSLPVPTNRNTFIINGKEYIIHNQLRLNPAIYTKFDRNDLATADFNLAKGRNMSIKYMPAKEQMMLSIGNSNVPLYTLLKDVYNVHDNALARTFGNDYHNQEIHHYRGDNKNLVKLHNMLFKGTDTKLPQNPNDIAHQIATKLESTKMNGGTNKMTMGKGYTTVNPESVLHAAKEVLDIHKGIKDPTKKDNLAFKSVYSTEDFVNEKFTKMAPETLMKMRPKIDQAKKISDVLLPRRINDLMNDFFVKSNLVNFPIQVNTMEMLENSHKITTLGEGGISDTNALPAEAREVSLSSAGFIDPVRTPDNMRAGVDTRISIGAWKDGNTLKTVVRNKQGGYEYVTPQILFDKTYTFLNEPPISQNLYRAFYKGRIVVVPKDKIDYFMEPGLMFTASTVTIPRSESNHPQRGAMGAKMLGQALSLVNREPRLVKTAPSELVNQAFIPKAKVDGTIDKIENDKIFIKDKDGNLHKHNVPYNFPLNYHSSLHFEPDVVVGQNVKKEQILGDHNFSVSGHEEIFILQNNSVKKIKMENVPQDGNIMALSLNCNNISYSWKPVTNVIKHKTTDPLLEITTHSGRTMKVTASHSCLTVNDNGDIITIRPSDMICNKTLLPVIGNIPIIDSIQYWNVSQYLPKTTQGRNGSTYLLDNLELSEDLGFFIGIYLSEGCITKNKRFINIGVTEHNIYHRTMNFIQSIKIGKPYSSKTVIQVGCAHLARALYEECKTGSSNVRLPDWVFTAPIEFRKGLIDGIWSGDGYISKDSLTMSIQSNSSELIQGLQLLLASIGIQSKINTFSKKYPQFKNACEIHHTLAIGNANMLMMPSLTHGIKNERLKNVVHASKDSIVLAPLLKNLIPMNAVIRRKLTKGYSGFNCVKRQVSNPRMDQLLNGNIIWDKVVSIKMLLPEEFVYDLSIDENETFVLASGLTVHNSSAGEMALGTNLNVAFIPYKGYNFEDAVVLTQQGADKLTSNHIFQEELDIPDDSVITNVNKFKAYYGNKFDMQQLSKLDGPVIRKGEMVKHGDPLIIALKNRRLAPEALNRGNVVSRISNPFNDISITWDKDYPGEVVDVIHTDKFIKVIVKAKAPMVLADKLSGSHGNKGVISLIVPNDEAPHKANGEIPDVILNPAGLTSRKNVGQIYETSLGKLIKEKGLDPKVLKTFGSVDSYEDAVSELEKHGVKSTDNYIDPHTKKVIPNVFNGYQYFLKLFKQAETGYSARAGGEYNIDMQPMKGGEEGSKSVGGLDLYGFLGHKMGSTALLHEASTYKSEYSPNFWNAVLSGNTPPPPQPTFAFNKFLAMLKGMGVNVTKDGNQLKLLPFTDKTVLQMGKDEISKPTIIMAKKDPATGLPFRPETGGLFDPAKTGGLAGTKWSHISLHEPVVNTLFEKPIRVLCDLKQDDFHKIAEGTKTVSVDGKNLTGGLAIKEMLNKIDPVKYLKNLQEDLANTKALTKRDTIIKKIKYLKPLVENGFHPADAYVLSKIPVIPPIYRPVYPDEKGKTVVSDANNLYKELIENNNKLKSDYIQAIGNEHPDKIALYKSLYNTTKKIQGFDGTSEEMSFNNREPQGFLKTIVGSNAKYGYFQGKLLAKRQDISGRAVIAPEPSYHIDQCGLPEGMAWTMYGPFVIGNMVKLGYSLPQASQALEKRTPIATNLLLSEMKTRPVIINRAPTLHKFNLLAQFPELVTGKQLKLPTMLMAPLSGDFDGDALTVHLPVTEAGKKEALNLLPSKNIFNPLNNSPIMKPDHETILGLHLGTNPAESKKTHAFKSHAEVIKAYNEGKLHITDKVQIGV